MAKFLFAWELGGGLGHAARIKPLVRELQARGHECTLMLRELVQTANVLRDLPAPRLQAPLWLHQTMGLPQPLASLPEILLGNGYLQAEHLGALVDGWLAALHISRADAVICDYAPTAVLAARAAGLPSATVGIGFYMPPAVAPIPPFRDWERIPRERLLHAETTVLANINRVLAAHGRPAMDQLWQLYAGDLPLLCTWPELDHYGRPGSTQSWWGPNFLPDAGGEQADWPEGTGPRVFAYLKAGHPDHAAWLQALVARGCRVVCYMPEVAAGMPLPFVSPAIHYTRRPADLGTVIPGCDLLVCHAGEATLAQGLLAGVPLLLLPMQPEQFLMARAAGRTGAAINVAEHPREVSKAALLARLLDEPGPREAARAFAARHAGFSHEVQTRQLTDQFEQLLERSH